jgi:hypothetical protein
VKQEMISVHQHNTVTKPSHVFFFSKFCFIHSGSALIKCGQCHQKLGLAHKEFIQSSAIGFMQPLKSFLDGEMKSLTVNRFF